MACNCLDCKAHNRREENLDRARATDVTVICVRCGQATKTTVGRVLANRGGINCCKKKERRRG